MIERVTILPYKARRRSSIYIEIRRETDEWISGMELTKDGDRTDKLHLIDKSAITKRMPVKMNLHYGILEVK